MDVDVGEGAHEHVEGQGGARQDYDDWNSSESDDGFCIQTDRSQGAEDEYTLDFNQNAGKSLVYSYLQMQLFYQFWFHFHQSLA